MCWWLVGGVILALLVGVAGMYVALMVYLAANFRWW